ncbi:hypothetical protein RB195_025813 [Necator americanus]|uniref:Uncharacterized protein n=1 Tax=Necator americanus TaxID=51031 RepID=A0ABR1EU62_NECAM
MSISAPLNTRPIFRFPTCPGYSWLVEYDILEQRISRTQFVQDIQLVDMILNTASHLSIPILQNWFCNPVGQDMFHVPLFTNTSVQLPMHLYHHFNAAILQSLRFSSFMGCPLPGLTIPFNVFATAQQQSFFLNPNHHYGPPVAMNGPNVPIYNEYGQPIQTLAETRGHPSEMILTSELEQATDETLNMSTVSTTFPQYEGNYSTTELPGENLAGMELDHMPMQSSPFKVNFKGIAEPEFAQNKSAPPARRRRKRAAQKRRKRRSKLSVKANTKRTSMPPKRRLTPQNTPNEATDCNNEADAEDRFQFLLDHKLAKCHCHCCAILRSTYITMEVIAKSILKRGRRYFEEQFNLAGNNHSTPQHN